MEPTEADLDTMPVSTDYLTALLTNERAAVMQALHFLDQEQAKLSQRLTQIDKALELRSGELRVLEGFELGRDLRDV